VLSRNLENEEAKAPYRAVKIQPQWVVTPGKQTINKHDKSVGSRRCTALNCSVINKQLVGKDVEGS
jgi:hypothetical protein